MTDPAAEPAPAREASAGPASTPPGYDALKDAKLLLRTVRSGALATLAADGSPFSSLVSVATLPEGRPVLLLSRLATHTRHLGADPRCSLLLARGGKGDPLAHARLTLLGTARRLEEGPALAVARSRFLRRQPKAALYADFPDFGFFVVDVAAAHLNGGFVRAARFEGGDLTTIPEEAAALVASEAGAVDHMNADHRDALALYAGVLSEAGAGDWISTGIDPEGIDLACGDRVARLLFDGPVTSPKSLRTALKELADRARKAGGIA